MLYHENESKHLGEHTDHNRQEPSTQCSWLVRLKCPFQRKNVQNSFSKFCFAHQFARTQDAQQSFLQGLWGPQGQVSISLSILSNNEVPTGEAHFHEQPSLLCSQL